MDPNPPWPVPVGPASEVLVRYNELAGVLASHSHRLLTAAGAGDRRATHEHRAQLVAWCRESLEPTLEQLLHTAGGTDEDGEGAALAIAEHVASLKHTVARLDSDSGDRRIAVGAIQLRVRLHRLIRLIDGLMVASLARTLLPRVPPGDS